MKKHWFIIAVTILTFTSLCFAQASKQKNKSKAPNSEAAQSQQPNTCGAGYLRVPSKTKGSRCLRLVTVAPDGPPPPEGIIVACPYPKKFSSCHGSGHWGCGSVNGERACWSN